MSLVKWLKKVWKNFMGIPLESLEFPEFEQDEVRRYKIIFSGSVQGVGFRYEMWLMAEKLGLTGFVENLPNGNVQAEIQGMKNRILYLMDYLKSIKRIRIDKIEIDELELKEEKRFAAIY